MKPFTFRLESILRYRKYLEKRAQGNLARAREELSRREKSVQSIHQRRKDIEVESENRVAKGIDVSVYRLYFAFSQRLQDDLDEAIHRLMESEKEVHTKKIAVKEASVKKKSLSVLRDQYWKEYTEGLEKEERKALDELVIMRRGQTV